MDLPGMIDVRVTVVGFGPFRALGHPEENVCQFVHTATDDGRSPNMQKITNISLSGKMCVTLAVANSKPKTGRVRRSRPDLLPDRSTRDQRHCQASPSPPPSRRHVYFLGRYGVDKIEVAHMLLEPLVQGEAMTNAAPASIVSLPKLYPWVEMGKEWVEILPRLPSPR